MKTIKKTTVEKYDEKGNLVSKEVVTVEEEQDLKPDYHYRDYFKNRPLWCEDMIGPVDPEFTNNPVFYKDDTRLGQFNADI